jgi:hypothetical protein
MYFKFVTLVAFHAFIAEKASVTNCVPTPY